MEAIRKTLIWRFSTLWPLRPPQSSPVLHCLPSSARDPFGRPILVIEAVPLKDYSDTLKPYIIQTFERLRVLLKQLMDDGASGLHLPTLQYIILLDLKEFSYKNFVSLAVTCSESVPDQ